MATETVGTEPAGTPAVAMVDPRAPRFGQALTATGMGLGTVFGQPLFVIAVATVLCLSVVSGWRIDLYGVLWRHVLIPLVGKPTEREPASPHRFAKLLGAVVSLLASVALGVGFTQVGFALAATVATLAGLAAITDICIGCRMYRQVAFFRRLGVI